ncbi:MAG: M56 family metallopeptidase [Oscillospiraceae bacterium]|nr:M56 family metallopeptidase [Oscillospiraceae bacterium]
MTPEELFLVLLNRSLAALWLVLAILLLRPFLKKVSRAFCCAIWGLVAIRLLCPFSLQSVLSLIPDAQPIPTDLASVSSAVEGTTGAGGQTVGGILTSFLPSAAPEEAVAPALTFTRVAAVLWIVGMALIALYALGSYLHLRLLVREAVRHPDGYWQCDRIQTPFVLGLFRPRILLPLGMDAGDVPYVLAHERAHLARKDHWRKPIAFALLTVFWFQPVLWVAYFLLRRDVEFACDERAIRKLGVDLESRKCYAKALLHGSSPRAYAAKLTCPLAFGGLQVKRRVKSVMTYKRPAVTLLLAALLVCAAVAACFLTDPITTALGVELPVESADKGGAATVEPPTEPAGGTIVGTAGSSEKRPETVKQESPPVEEVSYEDWMARFNPSWGATEEDWEFCYVLNHVRQYYYENGAVYENFGTKPITLTVKASYVVHAELTLEESIALIEAMKKDPNVSAPYVEIASETVIIEIPAGERRFVSKNERLMKDGIYCGLYVSAATYNGVSAAIE